MQVAGKQRGPADVVGLDQAGDPALQPDGEAAVGGHAVTKGLQVVAVGVAGLFTDPQRLLVVGPLVQSLAAGDQLEAAEKQVEGVRPPGVVRLGVGVKGRVTAG